MKRIDPYGEVTDEELREQFDLTTVDDASDVSDVSSSSSSCSEGFRKSCQGVCRNNQCFCDEGKTGTYCEISLSSVTSKWFVFKLMATDHIALVSFIGSFIVVGIVLLAIVVNNNYRR